MDGSTPAKNIQQNFPDTELVTFAAYTDCLDPLRNSQVDAVTTDNVILGGYVSEIPDDFKIAGEPFTEEPYGIGLAKGDDAFRSWINDVLEASFEDGRWDDGWDVDGRRGAADAGAPDGRPLLMHRPASGRGRSAGSESRPAHHGRRRSRGAQ